MLIHRSGKLRTAAVALLMGMALASLTAPTVASAQADCEVPLFIKQSSGEANLMVLADNSFSMNIAIPHEDYDKSVVWTGDFEPDAIYFVAQDGSYDSREFNSKFSEGLGEVKLVNSDNGEDGRYDGNYLNWLYYLNIRIIASEWMYLQVATIDIAKGFVDNICFIRNDGSVLLS